MRGWSIKVEFVVMLCLSATACGESTESPTTDMGVFTDAAQDVDAQVDCTRDESGRCELITWTESAAMDAPVDHHTTFVHSGSDGVFVYVAGGINVINEDPQAFYDTLRRARINGDGSLGAWEQVLTLAQPMAFHALAQTEHRAYLISGTSEDEMGFYASDEVSILELDEASGVRERPGRDLGFTARLHGTAHVIGNRLYLIGGTDGAEVQDTTLVSSLDAAGTNGAWTEGAALPLPRTHHAGLVHDGRIYLFGGFSIGSTELNEVLRSVHAPDGTLTGWETVGTIEDAPWTASAFEYNDYVYLVGGGHGLNSFDTEFVDRARRAPFLSDGTVGEFEDVASPLPMARSHCHQTPVYGNHIYSVGGRHNIDAPTSIDNVYVGEMNEAMTPIVMPDAGIDFGITDGGAQTPVEVSDRLAANFERIATAICTCAPSALDYATSEECIAAHIGVESVVTECRHVAANAASSTVASDRRCLADAYNQVAECFESVVACGTAGLNACIDLFAAATGVCFIPTEEYEPFTESLDACAATMIVGDAPDNCNDSMESSSAVGPSVFSGTTLLAGSHRVGSCGMGAAADVSFKWIAPSSASYTVSLLADSAFNSVLYVLDSSCSGAELGCSSNSSVFMAKQFVTFAATEGQAYYFVVDGRTPLDAGAFHVSVSLAPAD